MTGLVLEMRVVFTASTVEELRGLEETLREQAASLGWERPRFVGVERWLWDDQFKPVEPFREPTAAGLPQGRTRRRLGAGPAA